MILLSGVKAEEEESYQGCVATCFSRTLFQGQHVNLVPAAGEKESRFGQHKNVWLFFRAQLSKFCVSLTRMQSQTHDTLIEDNGDDTMLETNVFDQDKCFEEVSQKTMMIPKEKNP